MRLFRRKATSEDEGERCPRCRERVPVGADECLMCGVDLRPLRRGAPDRWDETPMRGAGEQDVSNSSEVFERRLGHPSGRNSG